MGFPKVLVGAPVYSNKKYITPYWINSVKNFDYPNYDILVVDNSKPYDGYVRFFHQNSIDVIYSEPFENPYQRIANAREILNRYAVENHYDYLMSIEQDVIAPQNTLNTLLKHAVPIVGAPYIISSHTDANRRHVDYVVSASKLDKVIAHIEGVDVNEWYLSGEIMGKGLIRVKSCSLGCTLITNETLNQVKVRFNSRVKRADDSYFFQDCLEKSIPVYLDTGLLWKVEHIKRLGGEIQVGKSIGELI
jgi:GT2 family glycosyltransferase